MFAKLFSSRVQAICEAGASTTPVTALFKNKQYALLYFGAAWSPGCRAFSPQLQTFRARHAEEKGFEVLYVSLDRTEEDLHAYLNQLEASQGAGSSVSTPVFPALVYEDALVQAPVLMGDFDATTIPTVLVFEVRTNKKRTQASATDSHVPPASLQGAAAPTASADSFTPRFSDTADTELTFRLVSRCGREHVESDPDAGAFPWAHASGLDAEAAKRALSRRQGRRGPLVAGVAVVLSMVAVAAFYRNGRR